MVELQDSLYQGIRPFSVALDTERVQMELVYPSQLQLSWSRPPFPLAHTKMLPFPFLPFATPLMKALLARLPGPSTVLPSSSGPQEALGGIEITNYNSSTDRLTCKYQCADC